MAAKVILLSESKKQSVKVTRVVAEYLVRQLFAIQIGKYLYQRVRVREAARVSEQPNFPRYEPSMSPRSGRLRWEPPKSKQQHKAHPWNGVFV